MQIDCKKTFFGQKSTLNTTLIAIVLLSALLMRGCEFGDCVGCVAGMAILCGIIIMLTCWVPVLGWIAAAVFIYFLFNSDVVQQEMRKSCCSVSAATMGNADRPADD